VPVTTPDPSIVRFTLPSRSVRYHDCDDPPVCRDTTSSNPDPN